MLLLARVALAHPAPEPHAHEPATLALLAMLLAAGAVYLGLFAGPPRRPATP